MEGLTTHPFYKGLKRPDRLIDQSIVGFIFEGLVPSLSFLEEIRPDIQCSISESGRLKVWKDVLLFSLFSEVSGFESADWSFAFSEAEGSSILEKVYLSLIASLNKESVPEVTVPCLESGAVLFELCEPAPWIMRPSLIKQYELSILTGLLALLTARVELSENVKKIQTFLLKTLSGDCRPVSGLFTTEEEAQNDQSIFLAFLSFKVAGYACNDPSFLKISETIKTNAEGASFASGVESLWLLIDFYLENHKKPESSIEPLQTFTIEPAIQDPSTAMIGQRVGNKHFFCTLHGGGSGIGSVRNGAVEIIGFAPHTPPLEECAGFGIIGSSMTDSGIRRSFFCEEPNGLILKGCARIADPFFLDPGQSQYSGAWMDAMFKLSFPKLTFDVSFFSLDSSKRVFTFFVKAALCEVEEGPVLYPSELNHYVGPASLLHLKGESGEEIRLKHFSTKSFLRIIPLSGKEDFWGADFLIAYFLDFDETSYRWEIDFGSN